MKILVTGSSGLIGSETVKFYTSLGCSVAGIDNNMRKVFFGEDGDTLPNLRRMQDTCKGFVHLDMDIRNFDHVEAVFLQNHFDAVVHCAAQPSHEKAQDIPLVDFNVNATGTFNLLEAFRRHTPESVFVYLSTNKVYGDSPNAIPLHEHETRYDYASPEYYHGIAEDCRIDQCRHSLFGVSKLAGDLAAQEYGNYFQMKVNVLRAGCITGPQHAGVELHGFLSHLVKTAVRGSPYTVFGYGGKQVRDNLHVSDLVAAIDAIIRKPGIGEVFNLGGGRDNSISVLEAIAGVEDLAKKRIHWNYHPAERIGDHICYITNLTKFRKHYPQWDVNVSLDEMLAGSVDFEMSLKRNE